MERRQAIDLRNQRGKLLNEARNLLEKAEEENREMTAEEDARWTEIQVDSDKLLARAEKIEKSLEWDSFTETNERQRIENDEGGEDQVVREDRVFDRWVRSGFKGMSDEDRQIVESRFQSNSEDRAQAVGTDGAGGYTVSEGFAGYITEALLQFGGMRRSGAQILSTSTGNRLPFPGNDDTGNVGALLSENTQVSEQDLTFTEEELNAYTYTSLLVRVSLQLLQDNEVNMESYLGRKLGERLGRINNTHLTVGDGSSKPNGIFTAASSGKTAASATAITTDEILDLIYSVDGAYRQNGRFMFSSATELLLRKLKDGDNQYLWQPGIQAGAPNRLFSYPVVINEDAPAAATTTTPILFGDTSYYVIRDVKGITMLRLAERYADYLQVGFFAFNRLDGDLIGGGGAPIKKLTMA